MTRDPWEDFDRKGLAHLAKMREGWKAADAAARRELRDRIEMWIALGLAAFFFGTFVLLMVLR